MEKLIYLLTMRRRQRPHRSGGGDASIFYGAFWKSIQCIWVCSGKQGSDHKTKGDHCRYAWRESK